jgi:hypothetical protein
MRFLNWLSVSVVILLSGMVVPVLAQSSAHYSMKRVAVAAGAATMSSTNFSGSMSATSESPSGSASVCNAGARSTVGFWSVFGVAQVPIVLAAKRNALDPQSVDLQWSGADLRFQLFRDYTPEDMFNPANLDRETTTCSATDQLAFQSNSVFYSVIKKP